MNPDQQKIYALWMLTKSLSVKSLMKHFKNFNGFKRQLIFSNYPLKV
jgi:hypothetical protein